VPDSLPGLIVSGPVRGLGTGARSATPAAHLAQANDSVVYVSLPPGSVPAGLSAAIRDPATGQSVTTLIVDGGFDPVAIPGSVGDTLVVDITRTGSAAPIHGWEMVKANRPPVVVRTDPPPQRVDVPLNSIMVVVFSEPIDSATLSTGSVQLRRDTTPVAGTVRFSDGTGIRVEFHPDSLLASHTEYQLMVTQTIHGVNGGVLASPVTVPFTTGTTGPAAGLVFASVSAGAFHTCAVTTSGAAYCWGDNYTGALGDGTTASSTTPVLVAGGLTFATVAAGWAHTCGVTTAGALYCWGDDFDIPLGSGSTPMAVARGLTFASVSLSLYHACGVTTAGAAYCWSRDYPGEGGLGDSTTVGSTTPVRVAGGLTFAAVTAGEGITCGVTTAGAAYCWGDNSFGELGTGTSTGPEQCPVSLAPCSTVPVAVTGGLTFRQVDAKPSAACGLTTSGTAYCWGLNLYDYLGLGTKTGPEQCAWSESDIVPCTRVPTAVPGAPNLVSLTDSESYTCGLTSTGVAYCWGYPQHIGDQTRNTAPVAVPGGLTFATLSAGPFSACGVTPAGVAYCWGSNTYGGLGDGTATSSGVPVKVSGQP
jgi:alpha-tubulin suppressor-like RCC1 family protein